MLTHLSKLTDTLNLCRGSGAPQGNVTAVVERGAVTMPLRWKPVKKIEILEQYYAGETGSVIKLLNHPQKQRLRSWYPCNGYIMFLFLYYTLYLLQYLLFTTYFGMLFKV